MVDLSLVLRLFDILSFVPWTVILVLTLRTYLKQRSKVLQYFIIASFFLSLAFICHSVWTYTASILTSAKPLPIIEKFMDIFVMFAFVFMVLLSVEIALPKWKPLSYVACIQASVTAILEILAKVKVESIGYRFRLVRPTYVALALIIYFIMYAGISSFALIKTGLEIRGKTLWKRILGIGIACFASLIGWFQILIVASIYPNLLFAAYITALIMTWVLGLISYFSLAYKINVIAKEFVELLKLKKLDPLSRESRITALLTDYTSEAGECPFYDPSLPSKCKLDPLSRRHWDCEGRVFINGFTCPYILDYLKKMKEDQGKR
ncbi:MAG: hypothetical protein ACTSYM_02590 [Candidatus Baldrarchaeia archaeon]